jgi:hypothetical protein
VLFDRGQACLGQPGLLGLHDVGAGDLDAEVVQAAALAGVLQQHELERRLGDGEVGIPGPHLGGLGAEQLAVERDGLTQVIDVEGELHTTGHGNLPDIDDCLCFAAAELATRDRDLSI